MTRSNEARYPPIEDYGVIGDLQTAALVGPGASIDALCLPDLDSPSIFAAHVDRDKGGAFALSPILGEATEKKIYLPDTNILLSRFLSEEGIAEVTDFMHLQEGSESQAIVRRARVIKGAVRFRMICAPRFDYTRGKHQLRKEEDGSVLFIPENSSLPTLRLRSSVPLNISGDDVVTEVELGYSESATFILETSQTPLPSGPIEDIYARSMDKTSRYWRTWIGRCTYTGRWREMVHRSALALKLLTSKKHGSIVAAPSFGFPNEPGGERNWDYRYTWLRDAAFTTYAFIRLGYTEEAAAFVGWLENRIQELGEDGRLQIMYRIDGRHLDGELHLEGLEGYRKSLPIRIGSTNHDQLQLDIYGEIMDAVYLVDKFDSHISHDLWARLSRLVDFVCKHWDEPDAGIWEVRGGDRKFLFSRIMCWVAVDRGLRLSRKRGRPAPTAYWEKTRNDIYQSVFDRLWSDEKKAFVQFEGSTALDASALIMPLVRFISPTDPRFLSTLDAIHTELSEDSLVYRYRVGQAFSDELEGEEGTFSICSFWFIEALSRAGRLDEARYLFEKMLSYANPLGLFSEQLGKRGQSLGNAPQAFTHLALISAAFDLDRRLNAGRKRIEH